MFPERVNIEFATVIDEHTIKMRVWERDRGETLACGTGGACASVVASVLNGYCKKNNDIIDMEEIMRNYEEEMKNRVDFIRTVLKDAGAKGIVFGNSGGKDCALVAILCKAACDDTLGLIMPCGSRQNYESDTDDALILAKQYNIETMTFDLSNIKAGYVDLFAKHIELSKTANENIPPRLRMITLYGVAASQNRLVAGTGNRSERYMGYFTKWGDGAFDFNPIADLTVTEVYEFLRFLNAPGSIINKAPSAGLYDGQTDEDQMGISYENIDNFILYGNASEDDKSIISRYHNSSKHKRKMPPIYGGN